MWQPAFAKASVHHMPHYKEALRLIFSIKTRLIFSIKVQTWQIKRCLLLRLGLGLGLRYIFAMLRTWNYYPDLKQARSCLWHVLCKFAIHLWIYISNTQCEQWKNRYECSEHRIYMRQIKYITTYVSWFGFFTCSMNFECPQDGEFPFSGLFVSVTLFKSKLNNFCGGKKTVRFYEIWRTTWVAKFYHNLYSSVHNFDNVVLAK